MKALFTFFWLCLFSLSTVFGQNNVRFDAGQAWMGFMNVSDLPADGGAYQFGSPWEVSALKSVVDIGGNTLTLQPNFNTYADNATDPFWVDQTTMEGNKQMEASTFVEPGATFNDVDLTFSGVVLSNTLADGYTAQVFIKALDSTAGYVDVFQGAKVFNLPDSGEFSVSATGDELASGLVIQYGFTVIGPNANPANESALGSIIIAGEGPSGEPNDVVFSATDMWTGYMNVSDLPADGGAYQFGSPWAVEDLKSTVDVVSNTLTLQPNFNTYADNPSDPFWVDQTTMEGNKQMEALTFVEPGATVNGADLTFSGFVQSNTLADGYTAQFFIKALDSTAGFADVFEGAKIFDLPESGEFSVSATAEELAPGLLIQYGFAVIGRNGNPANEADLGSVVIGAAPVSVENLTEMAVRYYPNPTKDIVMLEAVDIIESISIHNLNGQQVYTTKPLQQTQRIDLSSLPAGTYVVRAQVNGEVGVAKLIKL